MNVGKGRTNGKRNNMEREDTPLGFYIIGHVIFGLIWFGLICLECRCTAFLSS